MEKENIHSAIEFLKACENQSLDDIRLATEHRKACMMWETEMMSITGSDSIDGVKQYIKQLKTRTEILSIELQDIRTLIGASPEETTIDEVRRLLNTKIP